MKRTKIGQNILTVGFSVLVLIFLYTSFNYSHLGRRMALFFGIPVAVLLVWVLIVDNFLKPFDISSKARSIDSETLEQNIIDKQAHIEPDKLKDSEAKAEWQVFGFIGFFFVLIYLFKFLVAIPIFIFLYLKLFSKESWRMSMMMTVGMWLIVYFGFVKVLGIQI